MIRTALACFVACCAIASISAVTAAEEPAAALVQQVQAILDEKASRTASEAKMDSSLLYAWRIEDGQSLPPGVPPLRRTVLPDASGNVDVDIHGAISPAVEEKVGEVGGTVITSFPASGVMRASVPLASVDRLAALSDVKRVEPAAAAHTFAANVSEGDVAHRADLARPIFGLNGSTVSVGVLSNGVAELSTVQASGDLPAVTVLSGQAGQGTEGTAMLEIVHDLAPNAQLMFATALGGPAQMAANIRALRDAGADVIVDDVIYFAEPPFQDGEIAQAVQDVTSTGVLYLSSAGNWGNLNDGTSGVWEGDFADSSSTFNGSPAHSFGGGIIGNLIQQDGAGNFHLLRWADPIGGAVNDYDLFLVNDQLDTVIVASTDVQDGDDDPIESINSQNFNDTGLKLLVVKSSGQDRFLSLNTTGGELQQATAGQTYGHSAAPGALSVAAVDVAQGPVFDGGESVETFSSDGPRRVFFQPDGTPITPGNFSSTGGTVRQKPDIAAADGVSTATPGFETFFGTSAAAPHAAAIGALLMEGSGRNPAAAEADMRNAAIDIEASGTDRDSGDGLIEAFDAADLGLSPVEGTPLIASFKTQLFTMLPGGGDLLNLRLTDGTDPWFLPNFVRSMIPKGNTLFSASQQIGSTTIARTSLINNTITLLGAEDPDLHTVIDFSIVGGDLYAAGSTPWPTSEQPPCTSTNGRVVLVDQATGEGTIVSSLGELCDPCDMVSKGGSLYVTEPNWPGISGGGAIIEVDPNTGSQTVFSTGDTAYYFPTYLDVLPSGDFALVAATDSSLTQWQLLRIDGSTGASTVITLLGPEPRQIAAETGGTVLVTHWQGALERIDASTGQTTVLNPDIANVRDIETMPNVGGGGGGGSCGLGGEIGVVLVALARLRRVKGRWTRRRRS